MSYVPTEWKTGDIVTAEKLNNIESGIVNSGGGGMLITISQSGDDTVLDKTYTEIKTAIESGIFPYLLMPLNPDNLRYVALVVYYGYDEVYGVEFSPIGENTVLFTSETEDGVLTLVGGE